MSLKLLRRLWRRRETLVEAPCLDGQGVSDILTFTKGTAAEMLITKLFRKSGYTVCTFGRWKARDLEDIHTYDKGPSDHPDLIMFSTLGGVKQPPWLIEVKYRGNGKFTESDWCNFELQKLGWFDAVSGRMCVVKVASEPEAKITVLLFPELKEVALEDSGFEVNPVAHDECLRLIRVGVLSWK